MSLSPKQFHSLIRDGGLQAQVFDLLKDQQWHCRDCAAKTIKSGQYAGGGGIQGLQRGTRSRPGISIESSNRHCTVCNKVTRHDRWTGGFHEATAPAGMPKALIEQILTVLNHTDVVEQRERPDHELVVDHKFPMIRWGSTEDPHGSDLSAEVIQGRFQLLKKDQAGNHNLLKSRACEICFSKGLRGAPFGIHYYYVGNENWPEKVPTKGAAAERGCVGCGWYDFAVWREGLNKTLGK